MTLTVELPDDLASLPNAAQVVLEAVAVEAFRIGTLLHHEAASLAGLERTAFDALLKQRA